MLLLIIFGFVAGAATAVSPCVVPVLPIALTAGATGGRRKPLGVVTGLIVSFTFALFALVYVISALGLPNDLLRNIAIVVLFGFGIVLLIPPLAARVEAFGSRFAGRVGVKSGGDGFWAGVGLGLSLGVLYAPCAGPILAAVLTASASQPFNAGRLAVVFAYALGSGIVLYLLMLGGRKLTAPLARRSGTFQMVIGAIMVLVAFAMWQGYDTTFQSKVTANLPSFLTNPAEGLQKTHAAEVALAEIRGANSHGIGARAQEIESEGAGSGGEKKIPTGTGNSKFAPAESKLTAKEEETVPLNDIGVAPEFTDTEDWFNTPGDKPLTMKGLRGKVVLIDFWTYSCINCIRTLPYLNAWNKRYAKDGLVIVGVHTPEFPFEREASNVEEAIKTEGIEYPVVQDNEDGHLERLRQPLLARRVLRRRQRPRPLRPLRRGRIRRERRGDPRAPHRSRTPARQRWRRRPRDRRRTDGHDARVLPRLGARRGLHQRPDQAGHARPSRCTRRGRTNSPTAANGKSKNSR